MSDVLSAEGGGGDLGQQRLEEVVVARIDDGHLDGLPASSRAAASPADPAPITEPLIRSGIRSADTANSFNCHRARQGARPECDESCGDRVTFRPLLDPWNAAAHDRQSQLPLVTPVAQAAGVTAGATSVRLVRV
ncbi:MAG: hypothetical protein M3O70_06405 [Actinomycetota bacterium]|nr:hypothetical protein [Actinomycetota bacterium]